MTDTCVAFAPRSVFLPPHIVVLVHGNNGAASDFDVVEAALLRKFGADQLLVIKSRANEPDTSLGVEIGGTRLAKEVVETVFEYDLNPEVERYKLSIVGHSLGGLYARYALVQMMSSLSMLHVEYVSFVTICTPHLGSRRARGPSTVKNILRLGVHKVLSSRTIYGQTGVDLLLDPPVEEEIVGDAPTPLVLRPLLEVMSEPDSEFIQSLSRFRHGTLVAMTDGDVVVPYPSASMRSFSPYGSTFLTERYADWRWHLRHSGFESELEDPGSPSVARAAFLERLNARRDTTVDVEHHELGLDALSAPRFPSIDRFDCDNKQEVEFPHEMLCSQQQVLPWRRIDVTVEPCGVKGKLRLHDWCINKMQPPDCRADEFIDLLCEMLGTDHHMRPLSPPETTEVPLAAEMGVEHARAVDAYGKTRTSGYGKAAHHHHLSGMATPTSTQSPSSSSSRASSEAASVEFSCTRVQNSLVSHS